jgi:hypothetical protein
MLQHVKLLFCFSYEKICRSIGHKGACCPLLCVVSLYFIRLQTVRCSWRNVYPFLFSLLISFQFQVPTLTDFLPSKSTPLSRSSGLVTERLVQRTSLSSTQRWLAYSVAAGIQQFVGSSLGSVCLCVRYHWNTRSYCVRCVAMDVI